MKYPVVYCVEPIGENGALEATHTAWFCSLACREIAMAERQEPSFEGEYILSENSEYLDGTVCDECRKALAA